MQELSGFTDVRQNVDKLNLIDLFIAGNEEKNAEQLLVFTVRMLKNKIRSSFNISNYSKSECDSK